MCDVIVTAAAEPLEQFIARGGDEKVEGGGGNQWQFGLLETIQELNCL